MKWLHNILRASSLATALFIFQACYGSPQMAQGEPVPEEQVAEDSEDNSEEEQGQKSSEEQTGKE